MGWVIFILIYVIVDIYVIQAFKAISKFRWVLWLYGGISLLILGLLIYQLNFINSRRIVSSSTRNYVFGAFIVSFIPKLVVIIFLIGEDLMRFFKALYRKIYNTNSIFYLPSRRKFVSTLALSIAAIPFSSFLYGIFKGRYNFKVLRYTLEFDDLPEVFDGYRLTQISDIHSGSFDNKEKVKYAVNLINQEASDVVFFTGDLVNNHASEMREWTSVFGKIKAKDGVFSILGNHDYGDYYSWNNSEEKANNFEALKQVHRDMGWDLLLNENRYISKGEDKIAIIGLENWGEGGFKKAGDLDKACHDVEPESFKIVLTHDPSHWNAQIKNDARNFQLTLSGHTHGMQFGIEIPGLIKWSPAQYRYKHWAGIYHAANRFINVNRGFGYLAFPGRVGIWPEITVIELKKRSNIQNT